MVAVVENNSNNSASFSKRKNFLQTLKKKPIFLTNIFRLNVILYQMTVSHQKIKHVLDKKKLSSFDIQDEDIYKIIKTLDINKVHRHDEVSIRMLKLCDKSIVRPPSIIFTNCKLKISFLISGKKQVLFQFILPYISIIYQSPRLSFWVVS